MDFKYVSLSQNTLFPFLKKDSLRLKANLLKNKRLKWLCFLFQLNVLVLDSVS